jgi:hypothetical protein
MCSVIAAGTVCQVWPPVFWTMGANRRPEGQGPRATPSLLASRAQASRGSRNARAGPSGKALRLAALAAWLAPVFGSNLLGQV